MNSSFYTNDIFESREEMMNLVHQTARNLGYVIITQRSKKLKTSGFVNKVFLICDRGGVYKDISSSRNSGTKKIGCPFQLISRYYTEFSGWKVDVICDQHNHPPAQYLEGHAFAKRLTEREFSMTKDLTKLNMEPRDILTAIKEKNEENVSTIDTIYRARQKIRRNENVGSTPMQVLLTLLHKGEYVYEFRTNKLSGELEDLFFVHPISFQIWHAFPHVLIIDATYKTNMYNLPFLEIVGLTSTCKTFCIAFAFLQREKEDNFTWVLNCLRDTLGDCMKPRVIITDRELTLMKACQTVFPDAARLLCRWHIWQNVIKHCTPTIVYDEDWKAFVDLLKILINSPTIADYIHNLNQLQSLLSNEYSSVFTYLDNVWLKKYKECFVSVWIDQQLNFGNYTTNRAESQHALLKRHIHSTNYSLDRIVLIVDKIVKNQLVHVKASFEKSRIVHMHSHTLECLDLLRGQISIEALNIITVELARMNDILEKLQPCGCVLRRSCGLPCACEIFQCVSGSKYIQPDVIDLFWRKLDLLPSILNKEDNVFDCDEEVEEFKESFKKQTRDGKKSWLQKLKNIYNPSKTSYKEPAIQTNTRGRPTVKAQQQKKDGSPTRKVPLRRSNSTSCKFTNYDFKNVNTEPPRHSSYVNSQRPTFSQRLLTEISLIFHPYVTHIENVNSDGNCGYRALSVCLGYNENSWQDMKYELLNELNRSATEYMNVFDLTFNELHYRLSTPQCWMLMPYTGVLVCNRFGVIVHCLSQSGSTTCFPIWRGPEDFMEHKTITIAHVGGNHYVMVKLEGQYPMPPITTLWTQYRYPCAAAWETLYISRLQAYTQDMSSNSSPDNINLD